MIYVRGTHRYHFRSGEWAHLFSIQHDEHGRDIWIVEFPDGMADAWPSWDEAAGYEVLYKPKEPTHDQSNQTVREPPRAASSTLRCQGDSWLQHRLSSDADVGPATTE